MRIYTGPRLTLEQAVIVSAFTGVALAPFPAIQRYVEGILGRPVMTHEFADEALWREIKEAAYADMRAVAAADDAA